MIVKEQVLPMGPVASQEAIKEFGTNGGGFFNANSAHPYENPTPFTNFFEIFLILAIPAALTYTFGRMVGDTRQGWAIYIADAPYLCPGPRGACTGQNITAIRLCRSWGPRIHMEGKEVRFGLGGSALFSTQPPQPHAEQSITCMIP